MQISVDLLTDCFNYLDNLRASGITNMWGASSYLSEDMDLSKQDAKTVLMAWIKTFNADELASSRAESFLNNNKLGIDNSD